MGQRVLRQPARPRVEAGERSRRCGAVDAPGFFSGHRAGCARSVEEARADDAHDGPRAADGPDLCADCEALPRAPGPVCRRLRQGVVQADAPRHGSPFAVSRRTRSRGAADLAGPRPRRRPRVDRGTGDRRPQGQDPRIGIVRFPTGLDRLGVGVNVPWHRQARWRERGAHPPRAAEGLGGQQAGRTGERAAEAGADPNGLQRLADRRQAGLAG